MTTHTPQGNLREFPLRVVLTVTTGRLLTESRSERDNGIGDLHDILGHMTGEAPFTHALGRFAGEYKPWLYRWYPELDAPKLTVFAVGLLSIMLKSESGKKEPDALINGWLSKLVSDGHCHETYAIGQIPRDDHQSKDPYDEMVEMRGTDEGIIIL